MPRASRSAHSPCLVATADRRSAHARPAKCKQGPISKTKSMCQGPLQEAHHLCTRDSRPITSSISTIQTCWMRCFRKTIRTSSWTRITTQPIASWSMLSSARTLSQHSLRIQRRHRNLWLWTKTVFWSSRCTPVLLTSTPQAVMVQPKVSTQAAALKWEHQLPTIEHRTREACIAEVLATLLATKWRNSVISRLGKMGRASMWTISETIQQIVKHRRTIVCTYARLRLSDISSTIRTSRWRSRTKISPQTSKSRALVAAKLSANMLTTSRLQ